MKIDHYGAPSTELGQKAIERTTETTNLRVRWVKQGVKETTGSEKPPG